MKDAVTWRTILAIRISYARQNRSTVVVMGQCVYQVTTRIAYEGLTIISIICDAVEMWVIRSIVCKRSNPIRSWPHDNALLSYIKHFERSIIIYFFAPQCTFVG